MDKSERENGKNVLVNTSDLKQCCSEVSIIVPIYNAESFLRKCVTSILSQTVDDYELILVDDGSSDDSLSIAEEYAAEDHRIKIITQKNMGVSVARNKGLETASGKWVMFVDPDDFLEPTILEVLLKNIDDTDDIVACCCKVSYQGKEYKDSFYSGNRVFITAEEKKDLYLQLLKPSYGQPNKMFTAIGVPWGKLYRRSFLEEKNLIFEPKLRRLQDNVFNMYAFYAARRINYIDEALYNYRYEHLNMLYNGYNNILTEALCAYIQERFSQLKELRLFDDKDICVFYENECIRRIFMILRNEGCYTERQKTKSHKIDKADAICNLDCFQYVFSHGHIKDFYYFMYKIIFFLLKLRQYRLCYFIISARQNLKKENT